MQHRGTTLNSTVHDIGVESLSYRNQHRRIKPIEVLTGKQSARLRRKKKEPARLLKQALVVTRQRPTFPLPHSSSIIGLGGLNFRVRYGNGCGPSGNATGNIE